MDRRRLRAIFVLGLAVVPLTFLLGPHAQGAKPATAAAATGGPHSSMAGPTTFASIGPTATPASPEWNDNLAVPTNVPAAATASPEPQVARRATTPARAARSRSPRWDFACA
jgi:hypothetical protein